MSSITYNHADIAQPKISQIEFIHTELFQGGINSVTDIMCRLFLLLSVWCVVVNGDCSGPGVYLLLRGDVLPNNSYVLYQQIGPERLYCFTDKTDCCNVGLQNFGDWYLPSGARVLGGYEHRSINNVFARSRGYRSVGLYRHSRPQQRGRFWCQIPDSSGTNQTLFANIVNEIPAITAQPVSQVVTRNSTVTFSVSVSFSDLATYQWQKNNVDIFDETGNYHGATTPILTVINVQEEDEGDYGCVIDEFLVSHTTELSVGKVYNNTLSKCRQVVYCLHAIKLDVCSL